MNRFRTRLHLERLEAREVPTATLSFDPTIGTAYLTGDNGDNVLSVTADAVNATLWADGQSLTVSKAQVITIIADGGNGDDIITTFDPDLATATDYLYGGNGNDNLWGAAGPASFLYGGGGIDTCYDIVGGPNLISGDGGNDKLIGRATDIVFFGSEDKHVAMFGQSTATLFRDAQGTLYALGGSVNDSFRFDEVGSSIVVTFSLAGGPTQTATFRTQDVSFIASLLGGGDDTIINATKNTWTVAYGASGVDTFVGSDGDDLFKSGNGADFLYGNGGDDDLTGADDQGEVDVLDGGSGHNIIRASVADAIFADAKKDLVLIFP